jgi:hypothetical protein
MAIRSKILAAWNCRQSSSAKRIAEEMAKQIAVDVEDRSLTDVVVKDDHGEIVHTTPIRSDTDP